MRLSAPPVDGEANRELLKYLTKALGVAKGDLEIRQGHRSRRKVVEVQKRSGSCDVRRTYVAHVVYERRLVSFAGRVCARPRRPWRSCPRRSRCC